MKTANYLFDCFRHFLSTLVKALTNVYTKEPTNASTKDSSTELDTLSNYRKNIISNQKLNMAVPLSLDKLEEILGNYTLWLNHMSQQSVDPTQYGHEYIKSIMHTFFQNLKHQGCTAMEGEKCMIQFWNWCVNHTKAFANRKNDTAHDGVAAT